MFTFESVPVKFVGLIVLFAFCVVWSVVELARGRTAEQRASNALHVLMSVVMLLMVPRETWLPLRDLVGMPALIGVFVAGVGWFGWLALRPGRTAGERRHFAGHAAMFAAMAWHLAAMMVKHQTMASSGPTPIAPGAGMGGASSGPAWWAAVVGVPFMAYLLVAGVSDVVRALRPAPDRRPAAALVHAGAPGTSAQPFAPTSAEALCHEPHPAAHPTWRLHHLAGAAMNLGMFWMSTGLLVPVAPFMALFAF